MMKKDTYILESCLQRVALLHDSAGSFFLIAFLDCKIKLQPELTIIIIADMYTGHFISTCQTQQFRANQLL